MLRVSVKSFVSVIAAIVLMAGCGNANRSASTGEAQRAGSCDYPVNGEPVKPVDPPNAQDVINTGEASAILHMTAGDVTITMDRSGAPCTINSFLSLAEQGWLDNSKCHRLTDHGIFVLQCGDPSGTGRGGPGYTVPDELSPLTTGLEGSGQGNSAIYPRGTVAMANTGRPNTGGSQFFIVWEDSQLDPTYAVFGQVDEAGLAVVQDIASQGVDAEDETSPIAEARITSVTLG
ncbi:MAG: peptidylprolyl isomerase [Propionibacteriaceae bacterium]|nr:peptidylprolyl isomerase [Propionibacteriaceae bacterium]